MSKLKEYITNQIEECNALIIKSVKEFVDDEELTENDIKLKVLQEIKEICEMRGRY